MKTFKNFFEAGQSGDIDIFAKPPRGRPQSLGQTNADGQQAISGYINRFNQGADALIDELITSSGFDTNDYHALFRHVINNDKYAVNWQGFKDHVEHRFEKHNLANWFNQEAGEFNMLQEFLPIIREFVTANEEEFFREVFKISTKMSGTAVGDGEFIMGIIGNGIKGKKGDVDVIHTGGTSSLTLEVGTQNKIVGQSSRAKGVQGLTRKIWQYFLLPIATNVDPEYDPTKGRSRVQKGKINVWRDDQHRRDEIIPLLDTFNNISTQQATWVYEQIVDLGLDPDEIEPEKMLPETNNPQSTLNRILGGLVLYDYITDHNDDIIVSINFSSSEDLGFKGPGLAQGHDQFATRYLNVKQLGLENTITYMAGNGWYDFSHSNSGTRFTIGKIHGAAHESFKTFYNK
jgi:hypothetical protein